MRLSRLALMFFIFFFAVSALAAPKTPASGSLSIEGIRYGMNAGKKRIVIDLGTKMAFRAFMLGSPNRIVVDVPASSWKIARARFTADDILKGYRSGTLEGGVTRIIFDLKKPAVIANAFVLPKGSTSKDRLVIDVRPSSQNLFNARLEDVFGDHNLKGSSVAFAARGGSSEFRDLQNRLAQEASPSSVRQTTLPLKKPRGVQEDKKYTIIIDPGHGGEDPGAIGPGSSREKMITLATAKELRRQLEETGRYRVYLTRDKDMFVRLRERLHFSRKKSGDLFISIHADKIGRKNVRGASIYTLSEKASDEETARLADEENRAGVVSGVDLSEETQDVADILLDLAMREKMNESNLLARFLTKGLQSKNIRLLPNSHRSAGFAVLKAPDIPSVLLEIGFLSNPDEAKLLGSAEFQRRISGAILEGVDAYFRKIKALQKI